MKYQTKPISVEAVQFTGYNHEECLRFLIEINPDQYIVKEDGEFKIMDAVEFEDKYDFTLENFLEGAELVDIQGIYDPETVLENRLRTIHQQGLPTNEKH